MSDVLITGAGLIGMLCARECVQADLNVTVLERGKPMQEASWAGGGILSPLYPWRYPDSITALAGWSQSAYPALCDELAQSTGIDPELTPSGLMVLDLDDAGDAKHWASRHDAALQSIGPDEIYRLEPTLQPGIEAAIWMPSIAQVRNPRLGHALRLYIENLGVNILSGHEVTGFLTEHDRAIGVETSHGRAYAENIIVASGAWSGDLLASTGLELPVSPVRGQMILFHGRPGLVNRITLSDNHYVIPRRDGRILCGSTLEYVGYDKATTRQALHQLQGFAVDLIPGLQDVPIERHWAGLRPGSPDAVPFIGPHPGVRNLFINAGQFRNGVVLGPASARLLADQCLGRHPVLDPAPYLPEYNRINGIATR